MKVQGEITVTAPRDRVFSRLRDAHFFAACVDGVQDLTQVDELKYNAVFETRVAYMAFRFKVTVEMSRVSPPDEIEARIEGAPIGLVGRLTATSRARLTQAGDDTTIAYEVDAAITGRLGSLGQPVLKSKAAEMERQFALRLRAAFSDDAQ